MSFLATGIAGTRQAVVQAIDNGRRAVATLETGQGDPQLLRVVQEDRQSALVFVEGTVALGVVCCGNIQLARPEFRVRNWHHIVAAIHQR